MESTGIKKYYGTLQVELDRAKEDLKGVEESIKKMIGRDPNESPLRYRPMSRLLLSFKRFVKATNLAEYYLSYD